YVDASQVCPCTRPIASFGAETGIERNWAVFAVKCRSASTRRGIALAAASDPTPTASDISLSDVPMSVSGFPLARTQKVLRSDHASGQQSTTTSRPYAFNTSVSYQPGIEGAAIVNRNTMKAEGIVMAAPSQVFARYQYSAKE